MMIHLNDFTYLSHFLPEMIKSDFLRMVITILFCGAAILIGLFLSILLISLIYRHHRKTLAVDKWLQIENQGNTKSIFYLHPDSGKARVISTLFFEGRKLAPAPVILNPEINPVQKMNMEQAATLLTQNNTLEAVHTSQPGTVQDSKTSTSAAKEAKKKAKGTVTIGRQIGDIVGTLGSLLPGELGKSFKEQSAQIQTTTQKASQAIEEPEQKKEQVDHIQKQIKRLGGKKQEESSIPDNSSNAAQTNNAEYISGISVSSSTVTEGISSTPETMESNLQTTRFQKGTYQTPPVNEGDFVRLKLVLSPSNIYRSILVPFCIQSTQIVETETGKPQTVNLIETWQSIQVTGLPWYKSVINILLGILISAINVYWVILFIQWFTGKVI